MKHEFSIRVSKQGNVIKTVRGVIAASAKEAIAFVEAQMGVKPPHVAVDAHTGKMYVTGWSGYEFAARMVA